MRGAPARAILAGGRQGMYIDRRLPADTARGRHEGRTVDTNRVRVDRDGGARQLTMVCRRR